MIKDWNTGEVKRNEVFHFQNSLRPFIEVTNTRGDNLFLDLNNSIVYDFDSLEYEELFFYTKEEDEDFLGVEVDGKVEWVED